MTRPGWSRVESLFLAVADLPPEERALALAGAEDPALHAEVEELLNLEPRFDFLIAEAVGGATRSLIETAAASRVGERVGAYRLVREIGHGGMGTVYLAERADGAFRAQVALKFVRGAFAAPDLAHRLERERQILADLNHPNIVRLLDGGAAPDGTPFIVMEYVDGRSIDSWCDERELDLRGRVTLFLEVCDAVEHAHQARVIHRDLKPSNILVTPAGVPKLVDFGIARLLDAAGEAEATSTVRIFTPAYASPEHHKGGVIRPASDVYSLGVVLYRLVAARVPFDPGGVAPGDFANRVCSERPVAPSTLSSPRESVPALDDIILKALEKRPERRYTAVERMAADLRRFLAAPPERGPVPGLRRQVRRLRGSVPLAAALAVVTVAAVPVTWNALRVRSTARPVRFESLSSQVADVPLPSPFTVTLGDVNGDGRGDLIWNHRDSTTNGFAIGLATSGSGFAIGAAISHPGAPAEGWHGEVPLLIGDFNGDGRDDLLWNLRRDHGANHLSVALSQGDTGFRFLEPQTLTPALRWAAGWKAQVADLDGDGADDLVFNLLADINATYVAPSNRDGTFTLGPRMDHPARRWSGYRMFIVDVDGDGRRDLVWNDVPVWANRTYVARSRPGFTVDLFSQQDHDRTTWLGYTTSSGDVNGDGKGDLVWTSVAADSIRVFVALGTPAAQFTFLPGQALPNPGVSEAAIPLMADLNGDARMDLVLGVGSAEGTRLLVGLGTGEGRFGFGAPVPAGSGAWNPLQTDLLAGDVTGDGRADLLSLERGRQFRISVLRALDR